MTNPKPLHITVTLPPEPDEWDGILGSFLDIRLRVTEGDDCIFDRHYFFFADSPNIRRAALVGLCQEANLKLLESAIDQL